MRARKEKLRKPIARSGWWLEAHDYVFGDSSIDPKEQHLALTKHQRTSQFVEMGRFALLILTLESSGDAAVRLERIVRRRRVHRPQLNTLRATLHRRRCFREVCRVNLGRDVQARPRRHSTEWLESLWLIGRGNPALRTGRSLTLAVPW